jgi:hypothetical protein
MTGSQAGRDPDWTWPAAIRLVARTWRRGAENLSPIGLDAFPSAKDLPMRSTLLMLPLVCLAGCMSDTGRTASAPPPSAATPAPAASAPAAAAPAAAAPTPAAPASAARPAPSPVTIELSKFAGPTENAELFGYDEGNSRIFMYSNGTVTLPVKLAADGDYEIAVNGACDEANGQKAKFSVAVDGQVVAAETTCTVVEPKEYVIKAPGLKAGDHKIAISFLNDIYKENEYDLNFYVHGVTVRPAK